MTIQNRLVLFLSVVALLVGLPSPVGAQPALPGSWAGALEVGGTELQIVFHVVRGDDGLTATMDSPDQGATGIPVSDVSVNGDSVTLSVDRIGGMYEGALSGESTIEGAWTQGGRSFPLTLSPAQEEDTAPPPRPQHPKPPYPYLSQDVTFENESAGITLAGTLTRPEGEGPYPAVVLVSGSGPQDRNSEVFNHKLFQVLADHLTRDGIAVLRYDERGVGESEGRFDTATSEDFASDVATALRFLKARAAIDASEVGLLGMSEGGLVAPLVHAQFEPASFLVLMVGPGVSGGDIVVEQSAKIAAAQGAPASAVDSIRSVQRRTMEAVRTSSDSAAIAARLRPILEKQGAKEAEIETQIEQVTSPWFQYFVRHDPAPVLREVDVPVLALYGSNDLQVPPEQNVKPMRTALQNSPSPDVTVRVLDGLNHIFQPSETGLPSKYAEIETTMAPRALEAVSEWVRARTATSE